MSKCSFTSSQRLSIQSCCHQNFIFLVPGNPIFPDFWTGTNYLVERPVLCAEMGRAAQKVYLEKYTENINYNMLIEIYERTKKKIS